MIGLGHQDLDDVDVLILTRDGGPPPPLLRGALEAQEGARVRVHVIRGEARPDDPNRWATIARARNAARRIGVAPWVWFLDDDVIPSRGCLAALLDALKASPGHAAVAADYLGESSGNLAGLPSRHVAMGATLFRREVLAYVSFRWAPGRCECQCCCDDLRDSGFAIDYVPGAQAAHLPGLHDSRCRQSLPLHATLSTSSRPKGGRVLAAFDRRHFARFQRQFLATLRASGNDEPVTAFAYGLHPTEKRILNRLPGVDPVFLEPNGVAVPIRRLRDFPKVLERWPADTPVAYWDAGDVYFQDSLSPLWDVARTHPGQVLAVREPGQFPRNRAVTSWTLSVRDPEARRYAFRLLASRPFLNSGFAAGTASALLDYFREGDRLRHSTALQGTFDWGDQTALNLYCHGDPRRWREVAEGWNYCLCHRDTRTYQIDGSGRVVSQLGTPVHVVHGNAQSFRQAELSFLRG